MPLQRPGGEFCLELEIFVVLAMMSFSAVSRAQCCSNVVTYTQMGPLDLPISPTCSGRRFWVQPKHRVPDTKLVVLAGLLTSLACTFPHWTRLNRSFNAREASVTKPQNLSIQNPSDTRITHSWCNAEAQWRHCPEPRD